MLDILTIVHSFADIQTASRIRRTCRRLGALTPEPKLYSDPHPYIKYEYRVGDKLHRIDGHAREYPHGKCWYRGDIEHREYHPQLTSMSYRRYKVEGKCHREAGPSVVYDTYTSWYMRGLLHRKIGPADTWIEEWYTLDKIHRLDGPVYGNIYAIRGVKHNITNIMDDEWIVNDVVIRY